MATTTDADRYRKHAVRSFLIGVAVFLGGAISTIVASGKNGGIIWWGGMLFGVVLFVRAFTSYRDYRKAGGERLAPPLTAVAALGLVGCLAVGGFAVTKLVEAESLSPTAGSCWDGADGDQLALVPCSSGHDFKATQVVKDENDCPADAVAWVEGDGSDRLCLVEDGA
ncbi:hypothetical protein [Cellulomonas sp. HZM]|uniref:hypothetical protein n=1 Tax=Cellulomonas sp. HZM TaxID=1454010 RepID=UPI0004932FE7|nr:hypothetical protein [Cellulomonas sp. HZM]